MNIGILLPGFSSDDSDWAIPVQSNLVRALAQTDHVRVLALRYPHRRDSYTAFGARVLSLGAGQTRGLGRLRLWQDALRALVRLHCEQPFSVLHAMWADETGLVAAWAGRLLRVPVVVSVAGGELVRLDDIGYGLQRGAFSRWIVRQALTRADVVIAASEYSRGLIAQAGIQLDHTRVHTIPLGVDAALFRPSNTPPIPNRLLHVGSLVGVKNQAMLLRALARLEPDLTLDIIGAGTELAGLQSLAQTLHVARRVAFLGDIPHTDLPHYYQRAVLHVLTSRHEGQGMVTLEAAACGIPTVSTNVGFVPDEPAVGIAVPLGDDAALAQHIRALLVNPMQRAALGRSARDAVVDRYTIEHTAARVREVYAQAISVQQRTSQTRL